MAEGAPSSEAVIQRSFAAGELTRSLYARADLAVYQTGLRTCRNFLVRRQGGVANRPGTLFVAETKTSGEGRAYLYPFHFAAANLSIIVEAGDNYFRFHMQGQPVLDGDVPYELETPYSAGVWQDPARACWSQQGTIITITHLGHPPRELVFGAPNSWVLRDVVFGPTIASPTGVVVTRGVTGVRTFKYVVTAAKTDTYEESNPSGQGVVNGQGYIEAAGEPTPETPHTVAWAAVPGAVEYYVYGDGGYGNGTFGYLGTATGQLGFRDTGFLPDFAVTPPIPRIPFNGPIRWPAQSTGYQQRRIYAGTQEDREVVWTSQTGFPYNFSIRSPGQDDDAITFKMAGDEIQVATHLINVRPLILLTDRGVWAIEGDGAGVLRPTSINPRQQMWNGVAFVRPVVIGDSILFLQARGSVLRDLRLDQRDATFKGRDLCLRAAHLFQHQVIDRLAYAEVPDSTVWAVRTDGVLLGLTYIPEEELFGWHRHDTLDGAFEDVCVISEGQEDRVYCVVRREVENQTRRYVEMLTTRQYATAANAIHVDSAAIVEVVEDAVLQRPVARGLAHLNGKSVVAVQGGQRRGPYRVRDGTILFDVDPREDDDPVTIAVGLPITAQLETLTIDVPTTSVRDRRQLVSSVAFLLEASVRNFRVGPSFDKLSPVRAEQWDTAVVVDGRVELTITGTYQHDGRVVLEHTEPTPLTILAALPHLTVGG